MKIAYLNKKFIDGMDVLLKCHAALCRVINGNSKAYRLQDGDSPELLEPANKVLYTKGGTTVLS